MAAGNEELRRSVTGTAALMQWDLQLVETTGGTLYFDNASVPTTFQAVVGQVPEPSSLILAGIAATFGSFFFRRKRHTCCR
ncbi:MAG: PEP-CTERM sorting domain-containing protein [Thermoguttaceae bacterium]